MHLKDFLEKQFGFEFCAEQPGLARTKDATILTHVDDILFVGTRQFWKSFIQDMQSKFTISYEQLDGPGSSIKFFEEEND